jgi:amino acid adenylation domain-containing protein/thioester reductase-like protein
MTSGAHVERLVFDAWREPEQNLVTLFKAVVKQQPDKPALVAAEGTTWTYRQLDDISDRLAAWLQRQSVTPRSVVAMLLDKSLDYIVAALAIFKAHAAYLPIELAYPPRFVEHLLQQAKPSAVISKRSCMSVLPAEFMPITVLLDEYDWQSAEYRPLAPLDSPIVGKDLAILGYSSGTTGQPKGVLVSHRAVLYAYARFWQDVHGLGEIDRFAYSTFLAWDALNPLCAGGTGFVVPDCYCYDPIRLIGFFEHHRIQHTVFTPSLLNTVLLRVPTEELQAKLTALRLIWLGGEVTTHDLLVRALDRLPKATFVNNYGPVECFVIAQGVLNRDDGLNPAHCVPVGYVLPEMAIRLQNEKGELVAPGETGELYATGPCLADGYLGNPELTAEKFISINGATYYKTGDDAFLQADGRLVITGRHDSTVKVRGYNVNLAAIETLLKQESDISDCVVLAVGQEGEDKYLVAFVVAAPAASWEVDEVSASCIVLSKRLAGQLAHYMIPSVYFQVKSIPVDPASQKADKKQLLRMAQARNHSQPQASLLPANVTSALELSLREQNTLLLNVAERLLRMPLHSLALHDNLFENGLHSLLAVDLAMHIEELFGCRIPIEDIFSLNSVSALLDHVHGHHFETSGRIITDAEFSWPEGIPLASNEIIPLPRATHILLTGATGFVGLYMLRELLLRTTATITCLLRTRKEAPEKRLQALFAYYQILPDEAWLGQRVRFVEGDLAVPRFGLAEADYDRLCREVDIVFHCAGGVNFIYSYSQLKSANVDANRHLAIFALTLRRKMIHFVSSTGVYPEPGPHNEGDAGFFSENINPEILLPGLRTGYSLSKCVGEQVLQNIQKLGLATNIYRPGNIGSDRINHIANPHDTLLLVLDACRKIRAAPGDRSWFFELTPVDYVVSTIVDIANREDLAGLPFNIYSDSLEADRVFELLLQRGEIDTLLSFADWLQRLRQVGRATHQPMLQIVANTILIEERYFVQEPLISRENLQSYLNDTHSTIPAITPEYCAALCSGVPADR